MVDSVRVRTYHNPDRFDPDKLVCPQPVGDSRVNELGKTKLRGIYKPWTTSNIRHSPRRLTALPAHPTQLRRRRPSRCRLGLNACPHCAQALCLPSPCSPSASSSAPPSGPLPPPRSPVTETS